MDLHIITIIIVYLSLHKEANVVPLNTFDFHSALNFVDNFKANNLNPPLSSIFDEAAGVNTPTTTRYIAHYNILFLRIIKT